MNERRQSDDMRARRGQGFEGGRDMRQGREGGSQWRHQRDSEFSPSGRGGGWESRSEYDGQSGDRYERENGRGAMRDEWQGSRQRSGYGTNEGYGGDRGMGGSQTGWSSEGSWGSQGWSGESQGYGGYGRGGQRDWQDGQDYGRGQSYGGGATGGNMEYGWGTEGSRGSMSSRAGQGYGGGQSYGGGMPRDMEQSRYSGVGPKGYRRSDERIREDISDRLTDDGSIDASEIEVEVQGGEVTLTGTVPDREQKRRAEDIAESCSGVGNVTNHLRTEDRMKERGNSSDSRQKHSGSGQTPQSQSSQSGSAKRSA